MSMTPQMVFDGNDLVALMFNDEQMGNYDRVMYDLCIEACKRAYYRNGPDSPHNTAINMAIAEIEKLRDAK